MTEAHIIQSMVNTAKMKGHDAYVLVEDFGDIGFWNSIFTKVKKDFNGYFDSYHSGKSYLLKNYSTHTKHDFILCVDTDNELKKYFSSRPNFLFHTHTHSRENHLAHVGALQHWLKNTLNENAGYLENVLAKLSKNVEDIFIYYSLTTDNQNFKHFLKDNGIEINIETLKKLIDLEADLNEISSIAELENSTFQHLKNRLDSFCKNIKTSIEENYRTDFLEDFEQLKATTYVNDSEYLFYLQGHIVEDKILQPLMAKIMACIIENQSKAIDSNVSIKDKNDRKNQLNKLKTKLLDHNYCLLNESNCKFMSLIFQDVQNDFKTI
jgi:hypothetical protein